MALRIETIAIGDELLTGRISDTNSTFVADNLFSVGLSLTRQSVIPDDIERTQREIITASKRCDVAVVFGGLGPTSDDKTAEAVSLLLECRTVEHPASKERLIRFYTQRGREITQPALKQVLYPEKCQAIPNLRGMAPGFVCEFNKALFFFLPGVPGEMKEMFVNEVLPKIRERAAKGGAAVDLLSHTWRCLGIWESELQRVMDPVESTLEEGAAWLGYRTRFPENHLTLYVKGFSDESHDIFASTKKNITKILEPWCYTQSQKDLELLIADALTLKKWRIALAESCTAGLTANRLSRIPGASDWLWGGYTVYQTQAKKTMLHVDVRSESDAVSKACTLHLAESAKKNSGAEVAAAITGYLGPTGGNESDPVGTIYLCVLAEGKAPRQIKTSISVRSREEAQWGAATLLLGQIWDELRQSL